MNSASSSPEMPDFQEFLRTAPPTTKRQWSSSIQDLLFLANFRLRPGTDWHRYHQAVRLTCRLYGVEEHMLTAYDLPLGLPGFRPRRGGGPGWTLDEGLCKAIIYFNIDEVYAGEERFVDDMWQLSASCFLDTVEGVHADAEQEWNRRCFAGSGKFWAGMFVGVLLVVVVLY